MRKNLLLTIWSVLIVLSCVELRQAQQTVAKDEGWRLIVPLASTRQQVERLIGSALIDSDIYETENYRITTWYSSPSESGACRWQLPENTVVRMIVSPKKRPLLSEIGFDLRRFEKRKTPNDDVWNFVDEENGILIESYLAASGRQTVVFIEYFPTRKQKEEKCIPMRTR